MTETHESAWDFCPKNICWRKAGHDGECQDLPELMPELLGVGVNRIFEAKVNGYLASQSDDNLLERLAHRPLIMLDCLRGAGVSAAAGSLARSVFRTARELERRGYSLAQMLDHQRRIIEEDKHSFECADAAM